MGENIATHTRTLGEPIPFGCTPRGWKVETKKQGQGPTWSIRGWICLGVGCGPGELRTVVPALWFLNMAVIAFPVCTRRIGVCMHGSFPPSDELGQFQDCTPSELAWAAAWRSLSLPRCPLPARAEPPGAPRGPLKAELVSAGAQQAAGFALWRLLGVLLPRGVSPGRSQPWGSTS